MINRSMEDAGQHTIKSHFSSQLINRFYWIRRISVNDIAILFTIFIRNDIHIPTQHLEKIDHCNLFILFTFSLEKRLLCVPILTQNDINIINNLRYATSFLLEAAAAMRRLCFSGRGRKTNSAENCHRDKNARRRSFIRVAGIRNNLRRNVKYVFVTGKLFP